MSRQEPKKQINNIFDKAACDFAYGEALSQIQEILRKYPDSRDDRVLCKLGFLHDHLAAFEKNKKLVKEHESFALKAYQEALKFNPRSSGAIWGIGRIWWHRKDKRALIYAKRAAKIAIEDDPKMFPMYMNLAVVYETLGNFKRAEYWYKRIIKEIPDFWGAYYGLANLYYSESNVKRRKIKLKEILPDLLRLYKKESRKLKGSKFGNQTRQRVEELVSVVEEIKG